MTMNEFNVFKKQLKIYLVGYKRMNSKIVSNLKELGFDLYRCKKHYIFHFKINDKVLQFELDKTPGDGRSGIKTACDIARIVKKEVRG